MTAIFHKIRTKEKTKEQAKTKQAKTKQANKIKDACLNEVQIPTILTH